MTKWQGNGRTPLNDFYNDDLETDDRDNTEFTEDSFYCIDTRK